MTAPTLPKVGSIWYEADKRWPAEQRRIEVLAILDGKAQVRRASGLKTKIRLDRFGKPGGYKTTP